MPNLSLHHVSYPVRDIERSAKFYQELFELSLLARPEFGIDGVWLKCGDRQIHLVSNPEDSNYALNGLVLENNLVTDDEGHVVTFGEYTAGSFTTFQDGDIL